MAGDVDFDRDLRPRIIVFGAGGAGGNAVNNMIASDLKGVEFVVANTDAQALVRAQPEHRLQLGARITEGLGAGARPEIGRKAAEDSIEDIAARLKGAHMVFITAGMGGGTGTGAAPVIARAAREAGALTIAVVTKPFEFEGSKRMRVAEEGLRELEQEVETLIVIPNQNLFRVATETTTMADAFAMADEVLHSGVRGVTDLMTRPGLVNLDFADVRTVMNEMGEAMMGTGEAEGPRRAEEAANAAVANPLLDDVTLRGARAVLINITGGPDMTLLDVEGAVNTIRAEIDPDANIIVGSALDDSLSGRLRVSVVATGMDAPSKGARSRIRAGAASSAVLAKRAGAALDEPAPQPVEPFTFEPAQAGSDTPAMATCPDAASSSQALANDDAADQPSAHEADAQDGSRAGARDEARADSPDEAPDVRRMEPEEERAARSGGFSLFGRRRRSEEDAAPDDHDGETSAQDADAEDANNGMVDEEDLEIPAFLRRQAN